MSCVQRAGIMYSVQPRYLMFKPTMTPAVTSSLSLKYTVVEFVEYHSRGCIYITGIIQGDYPFKPRLVTIVTEKKNLEEDDCHVNSFLKPARS